MKTTTSAIPNVLTEKLIASGIRIELTPALKNWMKDKANRLLRHEPRIDRVRLDLEHDTSKAKAARFVVRGRLEISGPDLVATASHENAYKAIDLVTDKLDAALRRRSGRRTGPRNDPRLLAVA